MSLINAHFQSLKHMFPHSPDVLYFARDRDPVHQTSDGCLDKSHRIYAVSDDAYHTLKRLSSTKHKKADEDDGDKLMPNSSNEMREEKRQFNGEQIAAKTEVVESQKSLSRLQIPEALRKNESYPRGHFDAKHYKFISMTNSIRHCPSANVRCTTGKKIKGNVVGCCRMHANEYYNLDCEQEGNEFSIRLVGNTFSPAELGKCLLEDVKYVTCASSTTPSIITALPNRDCIWTDWMVSMFVCRRLVAHIKHAPAGEGRDVSTVYSNIAQCNVADSSTTFHSSSRSLDHKMSLPDKASNQIFQGLFTLSTRGGGVETVTYSCVDNDELELSASTDFLHQDTQCYEHLRLTTDVYVVDILNKCQQVDGKTGVKCAMTSTLPCSKYTHSRL